METIVAIILVGIVLFVYHTDQLRTKDLRIQARDEKIKDNDIKIKKEAIGLETNFIFAKEVSEYLAEKLKEDYPLKGNNFKPVVESLNFISLKGEVFRDCKVNIYFHISHLLIKADVVFDKNGEKYNFMNNELKNYEGVRNTGNFLATNIIYKEVLDLKDIYEL